MGIKKIVFLALVFLGCSSLIAQTKQITNNGQIWTSYQNQTRLSNKWGLWLDLHLRTKEQMVSDFSQAIFRIGGTYYLNDQTKFTVGYAFVNQFPGDIHNKISRPEHRPWQQLQWHTNYGKLKAMQWIRFEQRFRRRILNDSTLGPSHNFNYRIRYNLQFQVPFKKQDVKPGDFSFVMNDEMHINFGKEIVYNYFDQNRFFVGFAYHVTPNANLQFGYMNVFQQLSAGNRYRNLHVARLFYFHHIDLRKKGD